MWYIVGFCVIGLIGLLIEVKNAPEVDYGEDEDTIRQMRKFNEELKRKEFEKNVDKTVEEILNQ